MGAACVCNVSIDRQKEQKVEKDQRRGLKKTVNTGQGLVMQVMAQQRQKKKMNESPAWVITNRREALEGEEGSDKQ